MRQHLRQAPQHTVPDELVSLRAAATAGRSNAQKLLGEKYLFGEGVKRDYRQAAEWLNRAALRNEPGAQELLRRVDALVLGAKGVLRQHIREAARGSTPVDLRFLCLAVEEGVAETPMMFIENYFSGGGVDHDYRRTAEWLSRAASRGLPGAEQLLRQYVHHARRCKSTHGAEFLQTAAEGVDNGKELLSHGRQSDQTAKRKRGKKRRKRRRRNKSVLKRQETSPRSKNPEIWPGSTGSADH